MRTVNERALSVALLQSEREVLHTPGLDLSAFLTSDPRWNVQLFTDRNFEGLAETASQFDCLVFGFNVLHLTESLRTMLQAKPPSTGMVILHQLRSEAFAFLPEDLRVGVAEVDARRDRVLTPLHRKPHDEILLNWPDEVAVEDIEGETGLAGSAICYLQNDRPGRWRTVFDIEHEGKRLPVAVRTLRSGSQRVVLCNLWVEPSRPSHAALLGNMIRYAAMGFPEVAVLGTGRGDGMDLLAQKIRVQGTKVVELRAEEAGEPDPFSTWPLREVSRVVVGRDVVVPGAWRERGGTVVRVGEAEEVSITGGAPDTSWVAQQWAVWFAAVDPATWHGGVDAGGKTHKGSVFQSRAVLRMLAWIDERRREGLLALEAPPPRRFAPELGMMMALRIDPDGSLEGTVSSTAAARDINRLTGGAALTEGSAAKLEAWLSTALEGADEMSVADRLDIARSLGDADALRKVVKDVRTRATGHGDPLPGTRAVEGTITLAPMVASALRHACVATFSAGDAAEVAGLLEGLVEDTVDGLSSNLLLAADYLSGAAVFTTRFPGAPLTLGRDDCAANLVQSISAVGNYGHVVRLGESSAEWQTQLNGEVVSTEALALIEYLGMQSSTGAAIANTHVIASRDRGLPPIAVNQLIKEVQTTRGALTKAREDQRVLSKGRQVFGALILLLTAATLIAAARGALTGQIEWGWDLVVLASPVAAFGLLWGLANSQGLAPSWLERYGKAAIGWAPSMVGFVLSLFGKDKDDAQANGAAPGKDEDPKDG